MSFPANKSVKFYFPLIQIRLFSVAFFPNYFFHRIYIEEGISLSLSLNGIVFYLILSSNVVSSYSERRLFRECFT